MTVSNVTCMKTEYIRLKHAKWPIWSFKVETRQGKFPHFGCIFQVERCCHHLNTMASIACIWLQYVAYCKMKKLLNASQLSCIQKPRHRSHHSS
ncbi:hypothetical protein LDENG_00184660 [Lucifuga dentata]|nr:hypothetical protein LDENG_00184660 [Lucifuga dentata]